MTSLNINKKTFEKEIGILNDIMKENIMMFGTELESYNDDQIQLEITPNRPDLLSYQGFKRSFLTYLGKGKKGIKKYSMKKPEKNYKVIIDKSVKQVRPETACAIVKGLKFDDEKIKELVEIQEKLHNTLGRKRKKVAVGIYPLEKITFPITFKALEPEKIRFIPLESSSDRELNGIQILQRHPTGKDYAHLLSGKEKFPIFIDAKDEILSMPPIINSHNIGKIQEETKDVFIECSGFDVNILEKCLNIIVTSLGDMGGKIYQVEIADSPGTKPLKRINPNLTPEKIILNLENANKLLGLNLDETRTKNLLEKMGYNVSILKNKLNVSIPGWRTDILHEVDLIEDLAIAYGYNNFTPKISSISSIGEENPTEVLKRKLGEILAGLQLLETSSYHLTTRSGLQKIGFSERVINNKPKVEDSKTDFNILRPNLSHFMLKILSENINVEYPQKIFEIGKVFSIKEDSSIYETENLSIAITPGNFTDLKQIFEYLKKMLNSNIILLEPSANSNIPSHFIDGRVGEITFKKESIGFIGEVHPRILRNLHLKLPVGLLEINLDPILKQLKEDNQSK